MNRTIALQYVSRAVDDSGNEHKPVNVPADARLVGWQCGFEPMFVAVWSYLPNVYLDDCDAEELATDLLIENQWFAGDPRPADYII